MKNNVLNDKEDISKLFNVVTDSQNTKTIQISELKILLNKILENFYQIYHKFYKNISEEEFRTKFGQALVKMVSLSPFESKNLTDFSTEKIFDSLNNNNSAYYELFKNQYDYLQKITLHIPTEYFSESIMTVTLLVIIATIIGIIFFSTLLVPTIGVAGLYSAVFLFATFDFAFAYYYQTVLLWISVLNYESVNLAVCCQYEENGHIYNITNANISAYNKEDTKRIFGTPTLFQTYETPGWYHTEPTLSSENWFPPGYWVIRINAPGFEEKIIETHDIPLSDSYSIICKLTPK